VNINNTPRIIISRTDSIGDVALTLPICRWIKVAFPHATLVFLCKRYTKEVVQCFSPVDEILILEDLETASKEARKAQLHGDIILHVFPNKRVASWARAAGITYRIGTSHRWFHWFTCNVRVPFTRKKSTLHEAQLNFNLLTPLGLQALPSFEEIQAVESSFSIPKAMSSHVGGYVVLHPLSQGSAIEYPLSSYVALARALSQAKWRVFITGTASEGDRIGAAFEGIPGLDNLCGTCSLRELIALISNAHALVACSTGPLHLAGLMNIKAIGLFSSRTPIHPGRWKPLGMRSMALVKDPLCPRCASQQECACISEITVDQILHAIQD
jgi:heptosyltransferase III